MFLKHLLFLTFGLAISAKCFSQDDYFHYLVYLKDKTNSPYNTEQPSQFLSQKAIERRIRFSIPVTIEDLPVNENYISAIKAIGNCEIWNKSKWLNAVEVRFRDSQIIEKIKVLPFVSSHAFLGKIKILASTETQNPEFEFTQSAANIRILTNDILTEKDYGAAFKQNSLININKLHNLDYRGNGITIAVFDAGFFNAYQTPGLSFDFNTLTAKDFVTHDNSVWEDDKHGANVLGFMKTFNRGTYIGTAPMANYILVRTEDARSEYPVEEVNWLAGAEFADSMGADLISSSLGYNIFDDDNLSHSYNDLDGKTSIVARAANIAKSKGIFIVVSAGNEGASKWHKIGTPSDAKGVITIGATDADGIHADFSSYGPTADKRVKPDFVVMGKKAVVASPGGTYTGNGTSYATPIFAGALACLIQACPGKNFEEVTNALVLSATHSKFPDSAYGYGLPDMALAAVILGNTSGIDTTSDLFWNNEYGNVWTNQITHFRSSSDQTVEIIITGKRKNRSRVISHKKIKVKKGEWVHSDDLYNLVSKQAKATKRKKYHELHLEFISTSATKSMHINLPG